MVNKKNLSPGGPIIDGVYEPIRSWDFFTGARVSEERIQQLMAFDFESVYDLTEDDIFACNNRKCQALLWGFGIAGEKIFGEEKTKQLFHDLAYLLGAKGWDAICKHFNTTKVTPAQVAWYQDMGHIFYGPHCVAYTEYTEDTVIVTRQDCLLSMPPPGMEAMNKYVDSFCEGYLDAYRERAPYMTFTWKSFIKHDQPDQLLYPVDITKYPSFCAGKSAGKPFHQLVFKWKK